MEYTTFTEHNEWEGETWRFYIPIEGNQAALTELRALVDSIPGQPYRLDLVPILERDVDARVALDDGDYMAAHNKLSGRLTIPRPGDGSDPDDATGWHDALYKGGVKDWMSSDA